MTDGTDGPETGLPAALLPCPFCGGEAMIERYGTPRCSTIYACTDCGCRLETGEEWGHGRDWNRRADSALVSENRRLREALEQLERALRKDSRDKSIAGDTVEYHLDGQAMHHAINKVRAALTTQGGGHG